MVSTNSTVRLKQKTTIVRYAVAGALVFSVFGLIVFLYLNFANSGEALAGSQGSRELSTYSQNESENLSFVDLSHLSPEEMKLITSHDFTNDTIQKQYSSVKWNLNNSMSHMTLEVSSTMHEYSLELFSPNGMRVLFFDNLRDDKVFVDKFELIPNQQYSYLVKNDVGEIYAGTFQL